MEQWRPPTKMCEHSKAREADFVASPFSKSQSRASVACREEDIRCVFQDKIIPLIKNICGDSEVNIKDI